MSRSLLVLLKVAERCNINCSYCYFFQHADQTYRDRSARMSDETARAIAPYLRRAGATDNRRDHEHVSNMHVVFHGGEPLLLSKRTFDTLCGDLRTQLTNMARLTLSVQTNGIAVDDDW